MFSSFSDDITNDLRMILLNAVYFKADWKIKFDEKNTKPMPFYSNRSSNNDVPTMNIQNKFFTGYLEDSKAKFIQLPYQVNFTTYYESGNLTRGT